jgi:hypothetical protein
MGQVSEVTQVGRGYLKLHCLENGMLSYPGCSRLQLQAQKEARFPDGCLSGL